METILIVVTALAVAIAAGMAVVVVTMLRHERARSEARIEALSALAAESVPTSTEPVRGSTHFAADQVAQWREAVRPSRETSPSIEPARPSPRVVAEPIVMRGTTSIASRVAKAFAFHPGMRSPACTIALGPANSVTKACPSAPAESTAPDTRLV